MNENGKLIYQDWSSKGLAGKVRTILHIAGRLSAKELNEPLIEAIKQQKFDQQKYQTTTIINTDDTILGTGFLSAVVLKTANENSRFLKSLLIIMV